MIAQVCELSLNVVIFVYLCLSCFLPAAGNLLVCTCVCPLLPFVAFETMLKLCLAGYKFVGNCPLVSCNKTDRNRVTLNCELFFRYLRKSVTMSSRWEVFCWAHQSETPTCTSLWKWHILSLHAMLISWKKRQCLWYECWNCALVQNFSFRYSWVCFVFFQIFILLGWNNVDCHWIQSVLSLPSGATKKKPPSGSVCYCYEGCR